MIEVIGSCLAIVKGETLIIIDIHKRRQKAPRLTTRSFVWPVFKRRVPSRTDGIGYSDYLYNDCGVMR